MKGGNRNRSSVATLQDRYITAVQTTHLHCECPSRAEALRIFGKQITNQFTHVGANGGEERRGAQARAAEGPHLSSLGGSREVETYTHESPADVAFGRHSDGAFDFGLVAVPTARSPDKVNRRVLHSNFPGSRGGFVGHGSWLRRPRGCGSRKAGR